MTLITIYTVHSKNSVTVHETLEQAQYIMLELAKSKIKTTLNKHTIDAKKLKH